MTEGSSSDSHVGAGTAQSGVDAAASDWLKKVRSGDRQALARAITLVESSREQDRLIADRLVEACLPLSGDSFRVGVSGHPGAGKSTLIDRLGSRLAEAGHRVAVLTIDPSSERSGGSVLGDKTRMEGLSRMDAVFIRPSPARGSLGGVGARTRETIIVCEAAGFDRIIVETVGVGQSELDASHLVDFLILLVTTGGGDELQGIKRGVMEFADLIAVAKADGSNATLAHDTALLLEAVVRLYPVSNSGWKAPVVELSSIEGTGVDEIEGAANRYFDQMRENGFLQSNRISQSVRWMRTAVDHELRSRLVENDRGWAIVRSHEEGVRTGRESPIVAAMKIVDEILSDGGRAES